MGSILKSPNSYKSDHETSVSAELNLCLLKSNSFLLPLPTYCVVKFDCAVFVVTSSPSNVDGAWMTSRCVLARMHCLAWLSLIVIVLFVLLRFAEQKVQVLPPRQVGVGRTIVERQVRTRELQATAGNHHWHAPAVDNTKCYGVQACLCFDAQIMTVSNPPPIFTLMLS